MRTEAQVERERIARDYVKTIRTDSRVRGDVRPGEAVGLYYNMAILFFGEQGANNYMREGLDLYQEELQKVK